MAVQEGYAVVGQWRQYLCFGLKRPRQIDGECPPVGGLNKNGNKNKRWLEYWYVHVRIWDRVVGICETLANAGPNVTRFVCNFCECVLFECLLKRLRYWTVYRDMTELNIGIRMWSTMWYFVLRVSRVTLAVNLLWPYFWQVPSQNYVWYHILLNATKHIYYIIKNKNETDHNFNLLNIIKPKYSHIFDERKTTVIDCANASSIILS